MSKVENRHSTPVNTNANLDICTFGHIRSLIQNPPEATRWNQIQMKPEGLEFATNRVQYPGTRLRRDKGYWIRSLRTRNAPVSQQDERGRGFVSTILNRRLTGRGAGGLGAAGRRHLGGWGDQHAVSEDGRTVVRSNSRGGLPLTSGWHRSAAVGFAVAPGGLRLDGGRIRPVRRHDREHGTFPAATSGSTLCQWNAAAGLWRLQCIIDDLKI